MSNKRIVVNGKVGTARIYGYFSTDKRLSGALTVEDDKDVSKIEPFFTGGTTNIKDHEDGRYTVKAYGWWWTGSTNIPATFEVELSSAGAKGRVVPPYETDSIAPIEFFAFDGEYTVGGLTVVKY